MQHPVAGGYCRSSGGLRPTWPLGGGSLSRSLFVVSSAVTECVAFWSKILSDPSVGKKQNENTNRGIVHTGNGYYTGIELATASRELINFQPPAISDWREDTNQRIRNETRIWMPIHLFFDWWKNIKLKWEIIPMAIDDKLASVVVAIRILSPLCPNFHL